MYLGVAGGDRSYTPKYQRVLRLRPTVRGHQ
jgi:hypothetical protein